MSIGFAHSEHNPPCSRGHMRGSRPVGPNPPFDPEWGGGVGGSGGGGEGVGGYTMWGFPQQRSQTPNFACQTPNIACQTPNFLCQTPNKSCQTPNISCQTPKFRSQTPKFRSPSSRQSGAIFPKFRSKYPTPWATLPAVWSPRGARRTPPLCAQRGQMRGSRPVGPKPPL